MYELVRPELSSLKPYQPKQSDPAVKLDANESPFDLPPELKEHVLSQLREIGFNRYPEQLQLQLQSELASYFGVQGENVVLGNGSDELILMLLLAFGMGKKVIIPTPTFSMYRQAALIAGACPIEVPLTAGFGLNVDAVIQAAGGEPAVVFVCNPNNPSGNLQDQQDILRLTAVPNLLIVVDEAYGEFAGVSATPLISQVSNLVVIRTLSKAFSLAGARVGYAIAQSAICYELEKVRQPYNLDTLALVSAITALANRQYVDQVVAAIATERERVFLQLQALPGVRPIPSVTNFILFRVGEEAASIYQQLQSRGVLIRKYKEPLTDCLRVSIGTREENNAFLAALIDVIKGGSGDA